MANKNIGLILGLNVFKPELLQTNDDVAAALNALEGSFGGENTTCILEYALRTPYCLEFILSAVNGGTSAFLNDWILSQFPTSIEDYSATSFPFQLLSHFSVSLLEYDFGANKPSTLSACDQAVKLAAPYLSALRDLLESGTLSEGECRMSPVKRTQSNAARRFSKAGPRADLHVDLKPFRDLGMLVPTSKREAETTASRVLDDQKGILQSYLAILRRPVLAPTFKETYLVLAQDLVADIRSGPMTSPVIPLSATESTSPTTPTALFPTFLNPHLYTESAEGFGPWRIYLSGHAINHLTELQKGDRRAFEIVLNKMKELSNGRFSKVNQKRLSNDNVPVDIFEVRLPGDPRLVYQIDCVQEYESSGYQQVIRIFGIYDHTQVRRKLWDRLGNERARLGQEYCNRCRARSHPRNTGDDVYLPKSFGPPLSPSQPSLSCPATAEEDLEYLEDLHKLMSLEKYVPMSENVLNGIIRDENVQHVFNVSPDEQKVIEYNRSCFVQGRSGTGKTTTMLFKMFGLERAWQQSGCPEPRPRQVFVTKSRVLAGKVEEYFMKLMKSLALVDHVPPHILALLAAWGARERAGAGMYNVEELDVWRTDLPAKFSELEDRHFPLFITIDELCSLVQADVAPPKPASMPKTRKAQRKASWSATYRREARSKKIITFEVFKDEYWARLPQHLTKGLAPSLVFGEFIGVIKGSEDTLKYPKRMLTQEGYQNASTRSYATFCNMREVLYELFQAYCKLKRENDQRDQADRTHEVLKAIQETGVVGRKIDYLYIDEVQDNLLIDTLLLRCICRNPNGLFWAGDTAQTISVGSAFRFNELKSFLYRIEQKSSKSRLRPASITPPSTFQLLTNYRSHGGIVNCAHSIIELLQFWPSAIDVLERERGIVDGKKPLFVNILDTSQLTNFFTSNTDAPIELGHEQCILVRDNAALKKLEAEAGNIGVVLTLYESKGLEFDDVILWNFFEDSTVDMNRWRQLIEYALEIRPTFDEFKLAGLSSELKFLYVAITRARKNLWIVDGSARCEDMKLYWESKGLVEISTDGSTLSKFAVASTAEEWARSGTARTLFYREQYTQAARGFARGNQWREAAVADAYQLRNQAHQIPRKNGKQTEAYLDAGRAFLACANDALNETERRLYTRIAAECYAAIKRHKKAAKCFFDAAMYDEAVVHYIDGNLLDDAVSIVLKYPLKDSRLSDRITNLARFVYLKDNRTTEVEQLFSSPDEIAEFVEDHDLGAAHAVLMEKKQSYAEAAELYMKEGQSFKAIQVFLEDHENLESISRAKECLFEVLWQNISFATYSWLREEGEMTFSRVLEFAEKLRQYPDVYGESDQQVIDLFSAILESDLEQLQSLAICFINDEKKQACALLALQSLYRDGFHIIDGMGNDLLIMSLSLFKQYVQRLRDIIMEAEPWASAIVQQVFHCSPLDDDHVTLHRGTFLHRCYVLYYDLQPSAEADHASVSHAQFQLILNRYLSDGLRTKITNEHDIVSRYRTPDLCFSQLLSGRCNHDNCHLLHSPDDPRYRQRARLPLLQILILDVSQSLAFPFCESFPERMKHRRLWLDRLDNALNPLLYDTGSLSALDNKIIPEALEGSKVVRRWIQDILFNLDPHKGEHLEFDFVANFTKASSLGIFLDSNSMENSFGIIPCLRYQFHRPLLVDRGPGIGKVYYLRDLVDFLLSAGPADLFRGSIFFKHAVERHVPVDIGVLCRLFQRLCGLYAMSRCYYAKRSLHNLTLPRNWVTELWKDFENVKEQDCRSFGLLVEPAGLLLKRLYTGNEYLDSGRYIIDGTLYYRSRDLPRDQLSNISIFSICRSICLLGYNVSHFGLRDRILNAITSLRGCHQKNGFSIPPPYYRRYFFANEWSDLAFAVRNYNPTRFNGLVQLYSTHAPQPGRELPGVRRLFFSKMQDIPALLDAEGRFKSLTEVMCISQPQLQPESQPQPQVLAPESEPAPPDALENMPRSESARDEEGPESHDEDGEVGNEEDMEEFSEADMQDRYARPEIDTHDAGASTAQELAAIKFQKAFRRRQDRMKARPKEGLPAARQRLYRECLSVDDDARIQGRYRYLYLGPLPHLLLCLEWTLNKAKSVKAHAKRQMSKVTLHELDEVMERQTAMNHILKKAERLRKVVEPTSQFHARRDAGELGRIASEVHALMTSDDTDLPDTERIKGDMMLFWKGIVKKQTRARPTLNTEDL
ncbi:hypothetical protein DENSPDRAFT_842194 [Dentipellis sp. KUC8613]|nr:hypothetical protein DENSPDRAFT_842194 [Dentipellis sp. KUC8613]